MGKGDKKSKKGKITIGSYGVSRKKRTEKKAADPVVKIKKEKAENPKVEKVKAEKPKVEKVKVEKAKTEKATTAKKTTKKENKEA